MKIIFCYNEISYVIAKNIEKSNFGFNIIIISENRIERTSKKKRIFEISYTSLIALSIFIISIIPVGIEILIPHTKGGKILKLLSKFAYKLSFIDDGMDTFRENPKNIDINLIKKTTKYYTFNYNIPVSKWLDNIKIVKVVDVCELSNNNKLFLNLNCYSHVIIESPGISPYALNLVDSKYLIIKHPNPFKSIFPLSFESCKSGKNINVEKSLKYYNGDIIIGETLILVYLISISRDLSSIILCLKRDDYYNLECLHYIFEKCKKLILID